MMYFSFTCRSILVIFKERKQDYLEECVYLRFRSFNLFLSFTSSSLPHTPKQVVIFTVFIDASLLFLPKKWRATGGAPGMEYFFYSSSVTFLFHATMCIREEVS